MSLHLTCWYYISASHLYYFCLHKLGWWKTHCLWIYSVGITRMWMKKKWGQTNVQVYAMQFEARRIHEKRLVKRWGQASVHAMQSLGESVISTTNAARRLLVVQSGYDFHLCIRINSGCFPIRYSVPCHCSIRCKIHSQFYTCLHCFTIVSCLPGHHWHNKNYKVFRHHRSDQQKLHCLWVHCVSFMSFWTSKLAVSCWW